MNNAVLSFQVVSPIFLLMAVGYFLKKLHIMDNHTLDQMNDVSFKVFFPLLLFSSIYHTNVKGAFSLKLIVFGIGSVVTVFLVLMLVIPLIEKDNRKRGVLIQGIFRSNFVIFGLPISIALCGSENIGPTSVLIALIVPLYNALSIVALEVYRGSKINYKKILLSIAANPFIIGGLFGIFAFLIRLKLPYVLDHVISSMASVATPLALILLGASFHFSDVRSNYRQIILGVAGKLIIVPLIFIPLYIFAGFRGVELVALVIMIAAPTAVSSYTMAAKMEADDVLAGQLVVFDSLGSILTMFIWIFVLKQLALF